MSASEWDAGQVACLEYSTSRPVRVERIAKITPSGQIVLSCGSRFLPDGSALRRADRYQERLVTVDETRRRYHRAIEQEARLGQVINGPLAEIEAIAAGIVATARGAARAAERADHLAGNLDNVNRLVAVFAAQAAEMAGGAS